MTLALVGASASPLPASKSSKLQASVVNCPQCPHNGIEGSALIEKEERFRVMHNSGVWIGRRGAAHQDSSPPSRAFPFSRKFPALQALASARGRQWAKTLLQASLLQANVSPGLDPKFLKAHRKAGLS